MATTPLNSTTVIVDDTDPALVYGGVWVREGSASEFNATTHGTGVSGSSVQFTFRGTSVAVYGTVGLDSPTSAYLLDGGSPSLYAPGKSNTMVYQHLFYQSPTLANGEHTLLITDAGSGMLWIDYLSYTPSVPPQSVSSLASSSHSPSTILPLSSAFTSRVVTPTPSQQPVIDTPTPKPPSTSSNASPGTGPPDQVNSTSKSSIPGPAVAGGAIGALILIITLIFGMLYYRRRAKRLAGAKLLEKKDAFSGSSEFDKTNPSAPITPFTSTYTSSPHTPSGYGNPSMNTYPQGSPYPPSDYGYQNKSQPSTPIYHFSQHYALRPGYSASSDNFAGAGTGPGYGGIDHGDPQYEGTHHGYTGSNGQTDYLPNPHFQYGGVQQHSYTSSDRLAVPQGRGSIGSAESHASLAYLSGDRVAMNPSASLPDALPGPPPTQVTPQRVEKGGLIIHNDTTPELHQHEDGGVRLDVHHGSQQQQVIELPPVYKPNY